MKKNCETCSEETFYSCVKCLCPVCNRPECSTPVSPSTKGYSEEHPKRVGLCESCKSDKKKQISVTKFFLPK